MCNSLEKLFKELSKFHEYKTLKISHDSDNYLDKVVMDCKM